MFFKDEVDVPAPELVTDNNINIQNMIVRKNKNIKKVSVVDCIYILLY